MIDLFVAPAGFARMPVDMVNICADGQRVFTERIDYFINDAGEENLALRVIGVFEIDGQGKIAEWRDYYDTTKALG